MPFEETSDGAAYLSSLKNSGSPHSAATATARAPEAAHSAETLREVAPSSIAGPASVERRKSPRHKCKGSVRLQENGDGMTSWATFADISMHGCYVEAPAPLRVGAVLDLRLEVNGLRVEATGEVRVAYPNLGMGISFLRMSEENRERLRELVRSLLRSSVILAPRVAIPSASISPDALPVVANPSAALHAMRSFFENRHVMGRDEFLRILRKSQ